MNKSIFLSSLGLIALSAILFTMERFLAVFKWASERVPVQINGSGSYPSEPNMPGIFDNVFVGILLIIGLALLVFSLIKKELDGR
ncbi:MAG TPA: hypothetical protein GX525_11675 [Bacilli bacterium]|nr:hypothetical protein [Bacilli bacterium]